MRRKLWMLLLILVFPLRLDAQRPGELAGRVAEARTDAPVEILVHDDASRDGSVALLREKYPQVHVLASEQNVGFCVGNNRLVAAARGDYVLLLNNDAALAPDAVRRLLEAAQSIGGP